MFNKFIFKMRKFFSLLAAVLFAGSMMAGEVVFTKADFTGQGTVSTGSPVSATKDGVTFTCSKGYGADESLRCYAHAELSVTAPFIIQKINFTTTGGKDGGLEAEVEVNATSYKVEDLASQARFTEIKVTFDVEGDTTVVPVDTTVVPVDTTVVPVDTTEVPALEGIVITPSDFTPVTSADYSTTKEGVKVAVAASTVTEDQIRIFKGKTITISAATAITGIEFTCTAKGTAKYGPGCFQAQKGYTFEKDGDKGTWVGSATKVTFTAESNQVRVTQIIVALSGQGGGDTTVVPVDTLGPTNCAEAAEAALSVSANNELYNNGAVYTIEGYVTSIKTAYSDKFHNISFWMADSVGGGEVLQAYRATCASAADAPNVGDKVAVTGSLTKYNTTPEFAAACTYTILERAELVDSIAWDFVASQYVVYDEDGYVDVILFTNETYFVEEGDEGYEIYGDGDGVMLVLDIAYTDLADMAGTYQSSDLSLDLDYSYAVSFVGEQSSDIMFSSGTVTIVADTAQEGYVLTYSLVGSNGVTYEGSANIPLFEGEDPEIPTAEQTVDVVIMDGEIQADEDGFWVFGIDSTDIWIQLLISGTDIAGQYTEEDLDLNQSAIFIGEDYTEIYTANLVIAANGNGIYTLTGSVLCYNNTLYNVTMTLTDTTMGIEEALAAGKAVKMIRNGVLVIEKAGVKHSVMGQQIR